MTAWLLGGIVAALLIAGGMLMIAISHNGPAVLDAADRLTGGARDTQRRAVVSTGEHPQQQLVVWGPEHRDPADAPLPVLVFAHGGSWTNGNPLDYGFIARAFVPEGFVVVLVGYRLGEDGRYPAMIEDTARAVAWTHEEIAAYGGDPDKIVIAGHSAGAYNVAMVALEEQWLGRRGLATDTVKGVIGLSGPYDFAPFTSDSSKAAFGHVEDPDVTQPINHVRADAPPMLLVHGEADTLVKPRNTRALAERLNAAGGNAIPVFEPEMDHNRPLIVLAAPFRGNSDMIGLLAGFAHAVTGEAETSVPVQAETR